MSFRCWCWLLIACPSLTLAAETISHGRFDELAIYRPKGEVRQIVLFFSGERGWTAELEPIARSLAGEGALVAGIDSASLFRELERDQGECVAPEGDLENLSHFLQAYYRLPTYRPALLIGASSGAQLVESMLARAPAGTFGGGVSLGFCPMSALQKPLCPTSGDASRQPEAPWVVLKGIGDEQCSAQARQFPAQVKPAEVIAVPDGSRQDGFHDWQPQFIDAFRRVAARTHALPTVGSVQVRDLPIVEVPASGPGDTLAILISGDGGWAGIDKELAAALSRQGMPVVGLDSLRYFWTQRTPVSTAADVDRLVRHYLGAWRKRSVLLIGFSQGADVLPFVVNRLPATTRERLRMVALLSPSQTAVFEFHLQNWLGSPDKGAVSLEPELLRMKGIRALCVYGAKDTESVCPTPSAESLQIVKLAGGHHFEGDYAALASLLLSYMR
jgi:type IV secretory pathway VirJ component